VKKNELPEGWAPWDDEDPPEDCQDEDEDDEED
jgi:hypothetical protein